MNTEKAVASLRRIRRRLAPAALAIVSVAALTACWGPRDPGIQVVAPGTEANIGGIAFRGVLLVSTDVGAPGRLLGTLINQGEDGALVEISDADDRISVSLAPGQSYGFDTNEALFDSVADIPGGLVTVELTVDGESDEVRIPVMDGTLERYRPYVPAADR